jgi:hypothetical protein
MHTHVATHPQGDPTSDNDPERRDNGPWRIGGKDRQQPEEADHHGADGYPAGARTIALAAQTLDARAKDPTLALSQGAAT